MVERTAEAGWQGSLQDGKGVMKLGSGGVRGALFVRLPLRKREGYQPEELIAAAHTRCFSMVLALGLGQAGFTPQPYDS
jgi:osmotically inducible protein OsmC